MNDWRSTFDGANDHEADWEQCFVFLEELPDGDGRARLVRGRRARRAGRRPPPALGRPAAATRGRPPGRLPGRRLARGLLEPGDYVIGCRSPASGAPRAARLRPADLARRARPARPGRLASRPRAFGVPFVDYARGDGAAIGPGAGDRVDADRHRRRRCPGSTTTAACGAWTPATGSPASGRRPGRRYTRDGDRPPVLGRPARLLRARQGPAAVAGRGRAGEARSTSWSATATRCAARRRPSPPSCRVSARRSPRCAAPRDWTTTPTAHLVTVREKEAQLATPAGTGRRADPGHRRRERRLAAIRAGVRDDPRGHLHHASEPEPPSHVRRRALGEAWAALSVGLLIVLLAVVVWLRILPAVVAIPVVLGGYLAIEAFFDRSIGILLLRIAMFLAVDQRDHPGRDVHPRDRAARARPSRIAAHRRQPRGAEAPLGLTLDRAGAARRSEPV